MKYYTMLNNKQLFNNLTFLKDMEKVDEILNWKKTDLEVLKITSTYSETKLISGSYSPNYDKDLYEKYKLAVDYII